MSAAPGGTRIESPNPARSSVESVAPDVNEAVRTETDSMGPIEVPAARYWGAQTQRSLHHFAIGDDHMPAPVIRGMAILKKAAALVNHDLGKLSAEHADLIVRAADEVAAMALPEAA